VPVVFWRFAIDAGGVISGTVMFHVIVFEVPFAFRAVHLHYLISRSRPIERDVIIIPVLICAIFVPVPYIYRLICSNVKKHILRDIHLMSRVLSSVLLLYQEVIEGMSNALTLSCMIMLEITFAVVLLDS
jgi:hypothetical protein